VNDLPLLELFTRLREAGLPLGMDEYQLVLRALQAGYGISEDRAALAQLCRTIWVKSAEDRRIFNYHFEQVMSGEAVVPTSKPLVQTSKQRKIFQITLCVILGTLAFGLGFLNGSYLSQQNQKNVSVLKCCY
jgi:hypothetical protein